MTREFEMAVTKWVDMGWVIGASGMALSYLNVQNSCGKLLLSCAPRNVAGSGHFRPSSGNTVLVRPTDTFTSLERVV